MIKIIRGSSSRANARENLHEFFENKSVRVLVGGRETTIKGVKLDAKKYGITVASSGEGLGLSYIQIDAILELQLHRLTQLSVDEILKELAQIRERIAELEEILASDKKLKAVIVAELREVMKSYGDDRRTQIVDRVEEIKLEDLIKDEEMAITVSHAGYIKRTSVDTYRHQSRGGKGRIGAKTREDDFVEHFFVASAHSYILLFTSKGRIYWLKVYEIPEAAAATRGKAINNLVRFQEGETLTAVVPTRNLEETGRYVFLATKNGTVKKTELAEFSNPRPSGIIAINLDADDELIGAKLTDGKQMVFLASRDGQAILFRETEVRSMGRAAGGVNGMDLAKGDYVVSMDAAQVDFEIIQKEYKKDDAESRRARKRPDSRIAHVADAHRRRKGLRQAHAARRIPRHFARRQGRDQPEIDRPQRPGGRGAAGARGFRRHDHHRPRQSDSRPLRRNSRSRPLDAGRPPAAPRRRRPHRRCRRHPRRGKRRRRAGEKVGGRREQQ